MINKFVFYSDNSFTLNLPPIANDGENATGTIDWGDSTIESYDSQAQWNKSQGISHSYEIGGEYTVTIDTTDFTTTTSSFLPGNTYLTKVILGDGITTIQPNSFAGATNLSTVIIPSTAVLNGGAFGGCTSLTNVTIGNYGYGAVLLDSQSTNAFSGCTSLENIYYYTTDKKLADTTNSEYFIINDTTFATVAYKLAYIQPPVITDIPKFSYISVYDMTETNFTHNGLRILTPKSCTITEELNGNYSLTLEHIVDGDGAWLSLREFNIIKANGQLFRIYKTSTGLNSDGTATHTAYAQHIFYDLSHRLIKECCIDGLDGQSALNQIHSCIFNNNQDGYLEYVFDYYSDISATSQASYSMTSPVACLIGEDNCFVNRLGGELYRDNFYYSICNRKENSLDNAFIIKYGLNMLEVKEDIDYSDFCTYLHTADNYGNQYDVSYVPSSDFPHHYSKGVTFNYNENNIEALGTDMTSYFEERWKPRVTYAVKFANLHNYELYKDFINLKNFNVGDSGIIYCERLGINTNQKIISKTYDVLKDEVTSIVLGNFQHSLIRRERFANTITRADNIIDRVISPYKRVNVTQEEWDAIEAAKSWHENWDYNILEETES